MNLNGKIALEKEWGKISADPTQEPEEFPNNYGIIPDDKMLVIDADPRNFLERRGDRYIEVGSGRLYKHDVPFQLEENAVDNPLQRFCDDFGINLQETFTVSTGHELGGSHTYFHKDPKTKTVVYHKKYPGLEFKSRGHYLVGPGSIHPDTGTMYKVVTGSPDSLTELPEEALLELEKTSNLPDINVFYDASEDVGARTRYKIYLANCPPAIAHSTGNNTTLRAALIGKDYGLDLNSVFELMVEIYNPRCEPPWELDELKTICENAFKYGLNAQGCRHPGVSFDSIEAKEIIEAARKDAFSQLTAEWAKNTDGSLKPTIANIVWAFQVPDCRDYVNYIKDLVRYNLFTHEIEFNYAAPWHLPTEKRRTWADEDTIQFEHWLSESFHVDNSHAVAFKGMFAYARMNPYHPLMNYLTNLEWDGIPRIEKLYAHYCSAEDNAYTREVGRITMLGIVARIMDPGCKFDTMPILEGKQGTGKSTFVSILGGDYYADFAIDPHNKDTKMDMAGKSVIECSEMAAMRVSDHNQMKAFLSRQVDRCRKPYGRISVDLPRQCIFIGTVNPEEGIGYMPDKTGNRRYLPVATFGIRLKQLEQDRDQLYAEAYHRWAVLNEKPYISDPEVVEMAKEIVAERSTRDPWRELIEVYLDNLDEIYEKDNRVRKAIFTVEELAINALKINPNVLDKGKRARVAQCLGELGFISGKYYHAERKRTVYSFRRPPEDAEENDTQINIDTDEEL